MELRSSIPAAALDERDDEPRPGDGDGEFDWNDDLWAGARRDPMPAGADAVTIVLPRFTQEQEGEQRAARLLLREGLVLVAVAAFQAALAWRAAGVGTNVADQTAMVKAGHQEIAHLLHGRHVIRYETVLPGSPVLYPVLAAALDSVGGMHAVRAVNLWLVLLATVGVHCTARRLYGPVAGALAAGLFAGLGPTLHLSVSGTYDAPAACLLVWAAFFAVRFAFADGRHAVWLVPVLMLAANWTSYITVLWDPVILALVAFAGPGYRAWKTSRSWNAQRVALVTGVLAEITLLVGRAPTFTGIATTVMNRSAAHATAGVVLRHGAQWLGPVLIAALLGTIVAGWRLWRGSVGRAEVGVWVTLLVAGLLAPLNQLRWHSLDGSVSHCALSGAFAAVAAGAFLARLCSWAGRAGAAWRVVALGAMCAALVPLGLAGASQAATHTGSATKATRSVAGEG
ncbi:MAG TPA: hypothetical protein VFA06_21235 [Actinocrinis sp.]|uniref:hypothetical protein n=1 Tax=Actinocrinis sp. TaxID=1920516 RepID=UPI002D3FA166|nr:hypothetical protein [Actinocrinis sp.]HZU58417.1 hypothetical protein [Actinocrinis sp.]